MKKLSESLKRALPTIGSAVLMALAFPPANLSFLVLVCIAPWLAALRDCDAKGARRSGYLFGFVLYLFQMFWIVPFVGKWTGSYILAAIPWLVSSAITGLFFMLLGWLINSCWRSGRWWLIPFVWAGMEAFRAYCPVIAFPWSNLAHPLWMYPAFVQHAAFGTIFLVSAWLVLPNIAIANWIWPAKEKPIPGQQLFRMSIVFVLFLLLSAHRFSTMPAGRQAVVAVGQPGVDMAFSDPDEEQMQLFERVPRMADQAVSYGAEFLVLPEGLVIAGENMPPYNPLGQKPPLPVIFGARRIAGDKAYQSAMVYDGNWSFADKTRLVVFGEYVPFRQFFPTAAFNIGSGDLTPADKLVTPKLGQIKIGPLICFEGLFPDLVQSHQRNSAQVLAAMCIDDWYIDTPAWDQLWQSTVWRSIEAGAPTLRSAALGRTMAIDARGRVIAAAKPKTEQTLRVEVLIPDQADGNAYRFVFVWICWLAMLVVAGLELSNRFSKGRQDKELT